MYYLLEINKWPKKQSKINKSNVKIKKIFYNPNDIEKYFMSKYDRLNWNKFGFFWCEPLQIIINLKKFKTYGHKNNMIEPWYSYINYKDIIIFLRSEKLKKL